MTCLPQPSPIFRPPRVRMTDFTPAVLRFHDGGCATGSLEVISPTGGLLCLPKSANRGSRVKLMFLTQMGPVLGSAELHRSHLDRKSTRLNSSHGYISYAGLCLKKNNHVTGQPPAPASICTACLST